MLVEGGVVDARGQQGDGGLPDAAGRKLAQHGEQELAVALHLPDPGGAVEAAEPGLGRPAGGDHVRNAGGDAQVVLKHEIAVVGPHQVGAADGDPSAVRGGIALHFRAVLGTPLNHVPGDNAVFDDAGLVVDVVQEAVQRPQPLGQPGFQDPPLGPGDDAGDAVNGDDALLGLVVPVDHEGNAFLEEGTGHLLLDAGQVRGGHPEQGVVEALGVFPGAPAGLEHLVVDVRVAWVGVEVHRGLLGNPSGCRCCPRGCGRS